MQGDPDCHFCDFLVSWPGWFPLRSVSVLLRSISGERFARSFNPETGRRIPSPYRPENLLPSAEAWRWIESRRTLSKSRHPRR